MICVIKQSYKFFQTFLKTIYCIVYVTVTHSENRIVTLSGQRNGTDPYAIKVGFEGKQSIQKIKFSLNLF